MTRPLGGPSPIHSVSGGYVFLHRRLAQHPIWCSGRFTRGQAWVDLLLAAAHDDHDAMLGNRTVTVRRGQVLTAQTQLAARWRWDRETVRAFLGHLASSNMASIETSKASDSGYTLIALLNYAVYQAPGGGNAEGKSRIRSSIESAIKSRIHPASTQHRSRQPIPRPTTPAGETNGHAPADVYPAADDSLTSDVQHAIPHSHSVNSATIKKRRSKDSLSEAVASAHQTVIVEYDRLFMEKLQAHPPIGSREGKVVKDLLADRTRAAGGDAAAALAEILALLRRLFRVGTVYARERDAYSLPAFKAQYTELLAGHQRDRL